MLSAASLCPRALLRGPNKVWLSRSRTGWALSSISQKAAARFALTTRKESIPDRSRVAFHEDLRPRSSVQQVVRITHSSPSVQMEAELTILRRTVNRLGFVLDLARARSLLLVRFIVCFCIFTQVITCTSLI